MSKLSKCLVSILLLGTALLPVSAEQFPYEDPETPYITSEYALLYDTAHDTELFSVRADDLMYPASLTKIMTALVVLETNPDLSAPVLITDEMWAGLIEANASVAGFWPGDEPTVGELLYGVLLPSGADAVNALAYSVFGSPSALIAEMNRKAEALGMNNTRFENATGLHDAGHFSTPRDLVILLDYAVQNEEFSKILGTREYTTRPLASNSSGVTLESTSLTLINNGSDSFSIPGYLGGKTGYTVPAGRCLASHASFNGMDLLLVTGKSEGIGAIQDAASVYNWYSERYEYRTILNEGDPLIEEVRVTDTLPRVSFSVEIPESFGMDLPKDAVIEISRDIPEELPSPIAEGDVIGTLSVTANGQRIYQTDLLAPISAKHSRLMHAANAVNAFRITHPFLFVVCLFPLVLVLGLYVRARSIERRRRKRRKKRRRTQ